MCCTTASTPRTSLTAARAFYDMCWPRLVETNKTSCMKDAALELNYWCFENATYRTTRWQNRQPNDRPALRLRPLW